LKYNVHPMQIPWDMITTMPVWDQAFQMMRVIVVACPAIQTCFNFPETLDIPLTDADNPHWIFKHRKKPWSSGESRHELWGVKLDRIAWRSAVHGFTWSLRWDLWRSNRMRVGPIGLIDFHNLITEGETTVSR
jgi:hypothetical protein